VYDFDTSWLTDTDRDIIRKVQSYCADLHAAHIEREDRLGKVDGVKAWKEADAFAIAEMLNQSDHPRRLFTWMDEKTGHSSVGYETIDKREWFHILRQMRNTPGSGLLENLDNR